MLPFRHEIWRYRLEVLWVIYAAAYIFVGNFTTERLVSSVLALIGGVLVSAVFAQILFVNDQSKSRPILLIALTVSIFIMHESSKLFGDFLATIFAGFFALMMIRLLWESGSGPKRQAMKYRYFCTMSLVLVAGTVGLIETVAIKWIQALYPEYAGTMLFAPMGNMLLVGLSVGIIVGERALPDNLPGIDQSLNKRNIQIVFELLLLCGLAAVLICTFNEVTIAHHFSSQFHALPIAYIHSLSLAAIPIYISYQSLRDTKSPGSTFFGGARQMFVVYAAIALVNTLVVHFALGASLLDYDLLATRLLLVEMPISLGYGGSVYLWWRMTRAIASHMYIDEITKSSDSIQNEVQA